jgi:hypothetical protein
MAVLVPTEIATRSGLSNDRAHRFADIRSSQAELRAPIGAIDEPQEGKMLHNDLRHRAVIPMIAGLLIMIVLALIWRWIS